MSVKNVTINPSEIKASTSAGSAKASTGKNFDAFLGAVDAMAPMNEQIMYGATGSENAAAVLHGAFTGVGGAAGAYGYGASKAGGFGGGYGGFGSLSEYPGMMGVGSYGTYSGGYKAAGGDFKGGNVPGTDLPTGDLINTMNTNNLKLLELQAVMQSNMQAWNTKSNILSADHRARLSMIEKFTARG